MKPPESFLVRLTHAYWDIDLDIVWKTAAERIPELHDQLLLLVKMGTGGL